MVNQIEEALRLLGYLAEEPESVAVGHEAGKQYPELLAYLDWVEKAYLRRCTKEHGEWQLRINRPKWLQRNAVTGGKNGS